MIRPLRVPTPDGSHQAVHPDVVDAAEGFAGHRYWMACTPYPFGDDRLESPIIRVSDDGVIWEALEGARDPLVAPPSDLGRHWSDTDLTLHQGRLHLVFRGCKRGGAQAQFLVMTSQDGRRWTEPEVIWSGEDGVSPALHATQDGWTMWHIHCNPANDEPAGLVVHQGSRPGHWGFRTEMPLPIPGHVPWHLDVVATADGYEALVAAYPVGTNPSRCALFHLASPDGLEFRLTRRAPVLRPRWHRWNNRMVYRSTFTKDATGAYRIWFSGASWGMRCGIGLAEGPLDRLRVHDGDSGTASLWSRVGEDVKGVVTYVGVHRLPSPVRRAVRLVMPSAGVAVLPRSHPQSADLVESRQIS